MRSARLLFATACLALVQCVDSDPRPARQTPATDSWTGPVKTEHGTLLPIARIEGYGNPVTGELWIREVPIDADGEAREDGVESSAQALSRPDGYCELTVNNTTDPVLGSNPNDTFEFYTLGNQAGAAMADLSSFDPAVCQTKLTSELAADPFYSTVLLPGSGSGCARQRVKNFYSRRFDHVFMDVDVWNGNYATNGPYGPGFTNGTLTTRPGRHGPSQALGLWDFGPVEARGVTGDTVDLWLFFKNVVGGGNFTFSGHLVGEVSETCGNSADEDCDGVNDNNCGTSVLDDACYSDEDCGEGLACRGAVIASKYGAANAGNDTPGTCQRAAFGGTQLATGAQHSCAITPAGGSNPGRVKCWGSASSEGTGNPTDQTTATSAGLLLPGTARALSVAAGSSHSCAVLEDHTVRCWGANFDMQARGATGSSVMANSTAPLPLDVGAAAVQVVTGFGHTCVLRDDGGVRCFGSNYNGECGARSTAMRLSLHGTQDVALAGQAVQLCAGEEHTCALLDDGAVRCWGSGAAGRLGYGNTNNVGDDEDPSSLSPVSVLSVAELSAGRSVKSIACGGQQTCAILDDGSLRCWGAGVALGYPFSANPNLGDDELPSSLPLVDVGGAVRQVSIGGTSTCALMVSGQVKCWGATTGANGCLGYTTGCASNLWTPPASPIDLGSGLSAIELGTRSTGSTACALLSSGAVKCWGANGQYQAGYGDTATPISPARAAATLPAPTSTALAACVVDADCSPTMLCHEGMCVSRGSLRVSVTWTSNADLDLHVTTPASGTIQWDNASAGGGLLDDDDFGPSWNLPAGPHVENIAFPSNPPAGHYTFWVDNSTTPSSSYKLQAFYDGVLVINDLGTLAPSAQTTHFEIQYPAICGDGHRTLGEECDASYGCSNNCTILPGFECVGGFGGHSVCTCLAGTQDYDLNETCIAFGCGDGHTDVGETCDDGNQTTETCAYGETSCVVCTATCQNAAGELIGECGDGVRQDDYEECDDGNGDDDVCNSLCELVSCGDGITEGVEECDDNNNVLEDCLYGDLSCVVCGPLCTYDAGASTSYCGDGSTDGANGESCDDGSAGVDACAYGQTSCMVCNGTCTGMTAGSSTSYCGDGSTDGGSGETCDDGTAAVDACAYGQTSCTVCNGTCTGMTAGSSTSYCGDSSTDSGHGENCDDGNAATEACAYGQMSCTVCDSSCVTAAGATAYCGNSVINSGNGESCDDGNAATEACTYGQTSCTVCDSACHTAAGATAYCGDSVVNSGNGENCDDGNATTEQCAYNQMSCSVCTSTCVNGAGLVHRCGDGTIQGADGESCDDSNTTTEACTYGQTSCSVCDSACHNAAGATAYCGDSVVNSGNGENCDDGNATTEQCTYNAMSCSVCTSTCVSGAGLVHRCGDGTINGADGENCDDGNATTEQCTYNAMSCSVCTSTCVSGAGLVHRCGDSITQGADGETCDDGGTTNGNGCSSTCAVEQYWTCAGQPSVCNGICGDGQTRGTEQCDDANPTNGDGCDNNCKITACGNGIQTAGEECDDGNTSNGDSCPSDCTFNECAGEGGGNNCDVYANCTDTNPSFTCKCKPGFVGIGTNNNCTLGTRVFTSSGTYSGAMGGVNGANGICQSLATGANLGGTWKAWVSSSLSNDPNTQFTRSGAPYVLLDGSQIAAGYTDLIDGTNLPHPINVDENGAPVTGTFDVWTATFETGVYKGTNDCTGWTVTTGNGEYGYGDVVGATQWSRGATAGCANTKHIHCFEQSQQAARVFVTSGTYTGALGGYAGADATCLSLANTAGLGGRWKAWIGDGSSSPFQRFGAATTPYKLVDGTVVAQHWAGLTYLPLYAAINKDQNGATVGSPTFDVWTGTNANGTSGATNCNGWTDGIGTYMGMFGYGESTTSQWASASIDTCSAPKHLFCMEQLPGSPSAQPALRAFVTSTNYAATFGSVLAGDAYCQGVASGQALGGMWRAWLSAVNNTVASRFNHSAGPYVVLNGSLIAADWPELIAFPDAWTAINRDQTSTTIAVPVSPWTGTSYPGNAMTNCTDWTLTSGSGVVGTTNTYSYWSSTSSAGTQQACATTHPLFCFEQQASMPATKRAFATKAPFFNGNLGNATGADSSCQTRASAAGLGGTWKAWIATATSTNPANRFTWHGAYTVVGGSMPFAASWNDLVDGTLVNGGVNKDENGVTATGAAWTGTTFDGKSSGTNCSSWTSTATTGTMGNVGATTTFWANSGTPDSCANAKSLLCFEQ